ncbi:Putative xanthine dehydrogenase [Komagataella phaffii CBS 7435]|uniref:Xanthine dehydrogenase n=2 Tax=Komagataella phaffii TaxID=460519 RepID=C4R2U0_KOMPG|nr:Hypothetical protein PAS_chr2-2_0112 [Komagataella phaffii GS115]AOA62430.1 GQ67_01234T0 [Komagataella phaffii]CAH2447629.1 Putative xanthine dehydrogenase [Komagataella phaffii CBS 7435]AOA67245.1 GQ68_00156T0 [Komagataella phaffii GS115]CAY69814.1 Hypothetical protein PAS_chr2-2_0112 [Komagataella phaffii GS115]CCA37815.1 Putative xanthine dehydrogenase [Komagataella phaffii CBS 7435]
MTTTVYGKLTPSSSDSSMDHQKSKLWTMDTTPQDITVVHPYLSHIAFSNTLKFYLNGRLMVVKNPNPEGTLLDFIRTQANLTGTKLCCSEGGCGACTVTVAEFDQEKSTIRYQAVNSCIVPLISVDGKHLITVEGIGSTNDPHPVQERMAKFHGSQCGFCTPGIIMSMYALLRSKNGTVSMEEVSEALDGNLCRCTGLIPILDGLNSFAYDSEHYNKIKQYPKDASFVCSKGADCCRNKANKDGETESNSNPDMEIDMTELFSPDGLSLKSYDPKRDLAFPQRLQQMPVQPKFYGNEYKVWFKPTTKAQLLQVKAIYPKSKIVAGASEVQVEVKMKAADYKVNIFANDIKELKGWEYQDGFGLTVGGNISLSDLEHVCGNLSKKLGSRGMVYGCINKQLKYFAGRQIRNAGTPAGNIFTASPIADLNPVLVGARSIVTTEKLDACSDKITVESFDLSDNFFTGYRQHKLDPESVITKIFIPETKDNEYISSFKQSKRKDDDIAIVSACLRVQLDDLGNVVDSTLAYGGMAPMTTTSKNTESFIQGKSIFEESFLQGAIEALDKDYPLPYSVPGGMATYRRTLTFSFFFKLWQTMLREFQPTDLDALMKPASSLCDVDSNQEVTRNFPRGTRDLTTPFEEGSIVGKPVPHLSGLKQASGEAVYVDDIPPHHNELFAVNITSARPHAKILSVNYDEALEVEGVMGYVDINDVPSKHANLYGPLPFGKQPFFADGEVFYVGQTIAVILARDRERAAEAARKVKVEYEDLPNIISVEDGVEQKSFFPDSRKYEKGDTKAAFEESDYVFEGQVRMGAQEHFYFEPQGCLVVPEEDGEMKVYSSSQNPTETQEYAAHITGVPINRIVARVKRLGGGFGGKELSPVSYSSVCALAAKKFKSPVRMILSRGEDMMTSGQRHPFLMKYKIGVNKDYKFTAVEATLYANAGWSMDLTRGVVDRAVFHSLNCYFIPNVVIEGIPVMTNTASNTAFRGFGAPQGMFLAESMVTRVSEELRVNPDVIRDLNYFKVGQTTGYKQPIDEDFTVPELVLQNKKEAKFDQLVEEVKEFNSKSKWIKRGISHIPTMFGVSFGVLFLNQGGALLHIYQDGSVLVSHGGVEIGQGLNTKMTMIAAKELGVPLDKCFISETSTQSVPNTSATAASAASDLNGMAVKNACDKLNERLSPVKEKLGDSATWEDIIRTAYLDRISLSATGFYKTPKIGYVFGDPNPKPAFFYYTQGSAISVVEVDTLTGDWSCLSSHIKMDLGRPINHAIDTYQITGAYMQGVGLCTMEQSLWLRNNGRLFTTGPGAYKVPGFRDLPQKFHVSILKDREFKHLDTIWRSKGIGEPPLFLGFSVHFALRDAIATARRSQGIEEGCNGLPFRSPLTTERIRTMMADPILLAAQVPAEGNEWFIEA